MLIYAGIMRIIMLMLLPQRSAIMWGMIHAGGCEPRGSANTLCTTVRLVS